MLLAVVIASFACSAQAPDQPAAERTKRIAEWEALRYGMFIHFGMSTFTGHEFGGIPAESKVYNPTKLDVDQWIRVAKDAGMKYAVLTTKHCYGHALWPTKASTYSVSTSSVRTDVVRRFVDACRKHGIKPGFYYLLGWDTIHQPAMKPKEYEAFCRKQVTELLSDYGPITEMWFDIPFDMGEDNQRALQDLYALVKKLQPNCLVLLNQGFVDGSEVRSMKPTYYFAPAGEREVTLWPKDINNGEVTPPPPAGHNPKIKVGDKTFYVPMETCDTLARHWFWQEEDALNTVPTLYALYKATVGRGANLLLDAGPDKTGRLPAGTVRRLMELRRAIDHPATVPANLLTGKKATASNVYHNDPEYGPDKLTDGNSRTRWATDDGETSAWIEFDLGSEVTFDSAVVTEGWNRAREFRIEIPDGSGGWKAVYKGGRIGGDGPLIRFKPVSASKVRLNILHAIVGPTIWDFELYGRGGR